MFSGWRLFGDYEVLQKLAPGILTIDVLDEHAFFEGVPLQQLVIAVELNSWVRRDLAEHQIPVEGIKSLTLEVELEFRTIAVEDRVTNDQHIIQGRVQSPPVFIACTIRSRSKLATDEKVYEGMFEDLEEWPEDWAKHVASTRHARGA